MGFPVFRCVLGSDENNSVVEVAEDFSEVVRTGASNLAPFPLREIAALGRKVLFGESNRLSGRIGLHHPFYDGRAHPSTIDGLNSLVGRLCLGEIQGREIDPDIREGSAVVLGGPVSTWEARLIFGKGETSPLIGVPLPFSFEYRDQMVEAIQSRIEPWELVVEGARTPSVKECCIVTVLPMGAGDRIVNIAGLHGAGTRAIDFVLRDGRLLETIERQTRGLVGWQLFVEVHSTHDETPIGLRDVQVREIRGADFDSLRYSARNKLFIGTQRKQLDDEDWPVLQSAVVVHRSATVARSGRAHTVAPTQERETMSDFVQSGLKRATSSDSPDDKLMRLADTLGDDIIKMSDEEFRDIADELGGVDALVSKFDEAFEDSTREVARRARASK